jgi:hypothetical protein
MPTGFVPGRDMGTPNRDSESNRALGTLICPGCGAVSHLEARFCSQCGASIAPLDHGEQAPFDAHIGYETRVAGEVERRQLTVVFCDLVGSTSLATEVDPEDLKDIINAFFKAVADAMAEFDGYVARYVGDGVLVLFGYPEAHEDDAERAVHAALKALDDVAAVAWPHGSASPPGSSSWAGFRVPRRRAAWTSPGRRRI